MCVAPGPGGSTQTLFAASAPDRRVADEHLWLDLKSVAGHLAPGMKGGSHVLPARGLRRPRPCLRRKGAKGQIARLEDAVSRSRLPMAAHGQDSAIAPQLPPAPARRTKPPELRLKSTGAGRFPAPAEPPWRYFSPFGFGWVITASPPQECSWSETLTSTTLGRPRAISFRIASWRVTACG